MESLYSDLLETQPLSQTAAEQIGKCKSVHEYITLCLNAELQARSWGAFLIGCAEPGIEDEQVVSGYFIVFSC
jgi:hypothetical protein